MNVHIITKDDRNYVPEDSAKREIRVFTVVKNEMARLPYFLDYHRNLGANRFIFLDNGSTDGSYAFLLKQPDCHVFHTSDKYSEATSGIKWTKRLLDEYGTGHWCMVLDADELLVYPECETVNIRKFCDFLDSEGSEVLYTFLLDMYPKGKIETAVCKPGSNFIDLAPCFDKDYAFVDRISLKPGKKLFPQKEAIGGPRTRCFYKDQGADNFIKRLTMHVIERGIMFMRKLGIPFPYIRLKATPLFKLPLVKWNTENEYTASTHQMNRIPISSVTGALLHFKFLADFHERAVEAVKTGQYAQGSIEYKQYLKHMDKIGNLHYAGTREYKNSSSLLEHGLITTTGAYADYAAKVARQNPAQKREATAVRG